MRCSFVVRSLAATVFLILAIGNGRTDSPASPIPWELTSKNGRYTFEMKPPEFRQEGDEFIVTREAYGVAYQMKGKKRTEIWRVEGIYTFQGFLSEDGRYFVAMGPWASDDEGLTDVAFAIYDRGQLVKEYLVKDLVRDSASVDRSVSRYEWIPQTQGKEMGIFGKTFHIVTNEKTDYTIDLKTGRILAETKDPDAFTRREVSAREDAEQGRKGRKLYDNASFKAPFERAFSVSGICASLSKCMVHFAGPEWRATLIPKRPLPVKTSVFAVFPIDDDREINVSLTPAEIETALAAATEHPYFADRTSSSGDIDLTLRITGDRLHWDTEKLQTLHQALRNKPIPTGELRHWACVIISFQKQGVSSYEDGYLNIDTRELIYEKLDRNVWNAILLDAKGEQLAVKDLRAAEKSIP